MFWESGIGVRCGFKRQLCDFLWVIKVVMRLDAGSQGGIGICFGKERLCLGLLRIRKVMLGFGMS